MNAAPVVIINSKWLSCAFWARVQKRIEDIEAAKARAVKRS